MALVQSKYLCTALFSSHFSEKIKVESENINGIYQSGTATMENHMEVP